MNMLFVLGMGVAYEQYNVKHYGKREIALLDMLLLYIYLTHDWLGQYLGNYHNNGTHISSVVSHGV